MFDALRSLTKAAVNVATLPVSMAADVVTLGGLTNDRRELYTVSKTKRIVRETVDAYDEIVS